jgi:hypothetical protein
MQVLEVTGICFAALLALLLAVFIRRLLLMAGGGTIRLQVRVSTLVPGRGWSHGVGQFIGDELRFYRIFSFGVRPKRVLDRGSLAVEEHRRPEGPERFSVPSHWVILRCATGYGPAEIEIAMAESTVTGFLSWLEAAPPGQPGRRSPRQVIRPRTIEQ